MVVCLLGDSAPSDETMVEMGLPETEVGWEEFASVMLRLNGMSAGAQDLFSQVEQ